MIFFVIYKNSFAAFSKAAVFFLLFRIFGRNILLQAVLMYNDDIGSKTECNGILG